MQYRLSVKATVEGEKNPQCRFRLKTRGSRQQARARTGTGVTAKAFAEAGASVVLADWNEKGSAGGRRNDLASKGHKTLAVVSLTCRMMPKSRLLVKQTVATFGRPRCGV